jgi:hypothetical protein
MNHRNIAIPADGFGVSLNKIAVACLVFVRVPRGYEKDVWFFAHIFFSEHKNSGFWFIKEI